VGDLRFDGRVAVITGAGGGLGRSYALLHAERGASVVVNDLGGAVDGTGADTGAAAKVVDEVRAAGGTAVANTDSVTSAQGGEAIIQTALDAFGRLDILINNAGILRDAAFHKMTTEDIEAVISVHLLGSLYVTHPAYKHMREAGYGRIVVTTSAAGLYGNFGQVNYSAAKLGLVGMAKALAQEGIKRGVRTNSISPAALSRMTENIMPDTARDNLSPDLVAPVVAYLAHESCELNGDTLTSLGGHIGRAFVGETAGFTKRKLTVEAVAENLDRILDRDGYATPSTPMDALALLGAPED
jgi:NAD(P)-dependent dehydrogenase (short-subunit alcohol dehydrogenase family)